MSPRCVSALLVLAGSSFVGCATTMASVADAPSRPPPHPGLAATELMDLEHQRAAAITQGDAFVLEELLETGYRGTTWDNLRRTKAQEVQRLRTLATQSRSSLKVVADELEVFVYASLAVVTGREFLERWEAESREHRQVRFTHTWFWRDAKWQLVASHESWVPKP